MTPAERFSALVEVLTGPQGCPWDQKQTAESIIDYVIDEAHELKAALHSENHQETVSELGDLLFTVAFLTHSLKENAKPEDASRQLVEKMVRRHPHVFAEQEFADESELKRNWESEKRKENSDPKRYDQDLPASLPPLERTRKVLARASNAGFRYRKPEDAWDKVWEELFELEAAVDSKEFEDELGDLFLALLTLARMKGANASNGLARSTGRLCDRLEEAERVAGKPLSEVPYEEIRGLYLRGKAAGQSHSAFFNYCGVSPWPREVRRGVHEAAQRVCREGLAAALSLREEREALRGELIRFCGASADCSVVLVPNVSSAAMGVASCFPWSKGDRLLLGRHEFPANTAPWLAASDTFQLEPIWWDDDLLRTEPEVGYNRLETLLEEHRPRLMAVSAVSFWSGYRHDLDKLSELCHRHGTKLYVDAIQALGVVPLAMGRVDFLAGGSHKAMLSPEGAGFLLVESTSAANWVPRLYSWLSLSNPVEFLVSGRSGLLPNGAPPRSGDPKTLEGGSINALGYAGLRGAVQFLEGVGTDRIFAHVQKLQDVLEEQMEGLGWSSLRSPELKHRSSILSFDPPAGVDLTRFQRELSQRNVSVGIPNGRLRFGLHWPNTPEEIDYAVACCRALR